jgi:hypothetical protein
MNKKINDHDKNRMKEKILITQLEGAHMFFLLKECGMTGNDQTGICVLTANNIRWKFIALETWSALLIKKRNLVFFRTG